MALQIIVKNSSVSGNEPTAGQLANGELALNYHANGPFITCKDTAGVVRRVTGVWVNAAAPSSPTPGELWLDISVTPAQLKVYKDVGDAWVAAITVYAATTSVAGVVQLSDSISTTSSILAATPTAVKTAYDLANAALPKAGGTVTGNLEIGTAGSLSFEGATADGFETTIAITDPTADRTITLPNTTGTVVTTGDTGTVTSTMILDGTIVDADINASAEIAVSKLADGTARQLLQTDAAGTGVEWASNIDIPGTLDVTSAATFDSTVTIAGDLTVNGTTTNINTVNLTVEDKNIIIADVATPSDVTADGGGITLKGATDKTINWIDATDAWTLSEHVNIASAKEYRIAGTKVLDATSLGSAVVGSSLTSVGTIGTGVWQGTAIADTYLGTISTALKVSNSATTATSANTASAIVARDASGNFTAGTITATLTGNASTVTTNANLTGDVTSVGNATTIAAGVIVDADINASAAIVDTKLATIATAGKVSNSATTATDANTASAIVARDASGNFTAGTITAALTGAASSNVLKAGDTMTGPLVTPAGTVTANGIQVGTGTTYKPGIYSPGADQVAVATNGAGRLFIDSSGRVGVGTSPSSLLHLGAASGAVQIQFNNGGVSSYIGHDPAVPGFDIASKDVTTFRNFNGALFAETMRITSAGLVGIGSSSPGTKLEVFNTGIYGTAFQPSIYIVNSSSGGTPTANTGLGAIAWATDSNATLVSSIEAIRENPTAGGQSALVLRTGSSGGGTERLRITSGGLVGIGTTPAAGSLLHINSAASTDCKQQISVTTATQAAYTAYVNTTVSTVGTENSTGGSLMTGSGPYATVISNGGAYPINFGTNNTLRATIDSSGRLLVGTSSARSNFFNGSNAALFQVEGTTLATTTTSLVRSSADAFGPVRVFGKSRNASVGGNTIVNSGDECGTLDFQGNDGTEFVSLASIVGAVDGTPGANDMPGRLVFSTTVNGGSSPTGRAMIDNRGVLHTFAAAGGDGHLFMTGENAGTTYYLFAGFRSTTAVSGASAVMVFQVFTNGNVQNTNNSYGAISDIKLKENIVDATSQWNDLKALQVRKYNFKEGQTHTQIGLVAQEAELVSPGLVYETPDRDEDGNDLGTVTKSVNYSVLYMKAVKALQEAMERIETLEQRLTAAGID